MQQPLERYGVVVLLFLVALVAVAVFWEDNSSTQAANESLATVEPLDERPFVDEPARRTASRPDAGRTAPEILLGPEDQGVDQRGRTTAYGTNPPAGGPAAPAEVDPANAGDEGLSRAETRGGSTAERRLGEETRADLVNGGQARQDTLAKDLERAAEGAAGANGAPDASPPVGSPREYTVRPGESLWRIAERELGNGTRCKEIATLNGLGNSDHITEGMKLKLPAKEGAAPAASPATPVKPAPGDASPAKPAATPPVRRGTGDTTEQLAQVSGTRRYVVKSGDSLGLIAQRELGSAKRAPEIKQLNGMTSDVVKLGTALVLPGDRAVSDAPVVAVVTPKPDARRDTARAANRPVPGKERRASGGEFIVR